VCVCVWCCVCVLCACVCVCVCVRGVRVRVCVYVWCSVCACACVCVCHPSVCAGEKPFVCVLCEGGPVGFSVRKSLRNHQRKHHPGGEEIKFPCVECRVFFDSAEERWGVCVCVCVCVGCGCVSVRVCVLQFGYPSRD